MKQKQRLDSRSSKINCWYWLLGWRESIDSKNWLSFCKINILKEYHPEQARHPLSPDHGSNFLQRYATDIQKLLLILSALAGKELYTNVF